MVAQYGKPLQSARDKLQNLPRPLGSRGALFRTPANACRTGCDLTSLEVGGKTYEILTSDRSWRGHSHKKRDTELIGGGAGVGGLIGALVGHGKGAAIGAGIGADGGTATANATGRKDISIPAETPLRFVLRRPITVPQAG